MIFKENLTNRSDLGKDNCTCSITERVLGHTATLENVRNPQTTTKVYEPGEYSPLNASCINLNSSIADQQVYGFKYYQPYVTYKAIPCYWMGGILPCYTPYNYGIVPAGPQSIPTTFPMAHFNLPHSANYIKEGNLEAKPSQRLRELSAREQESKLEKVREAQSPPKYEPAMDKRTSTCYQALVIKNNMQQYTRPFKNLDVEFRESVKGRKRNCYVKSLHVFDFLNSKIIPEWTIILENISTRERDIGVIQKGDSFTWTQFFKDIRKFYRLIFRHRFHRCDKRKDSNRENLVHTILEELGITATNYQYIEVYNFFYPVLSKLRKDSKKKTSVEEYKFSEVFSTYSVEAKETFLSNTLSSQLICFFTVNYGDMYIKMMENNYKHEIECVIKSLNESYGLKA